MKSYMLSSMVFKHSGSTVEAFHKAFPHDWLLWEPGGWRAPGNSTVQLSMSSPTPPPPDGEALVFPMLVAKGQDQITLGRGPGVDGAINDGTLSQKHLLFMTDASGFWTVRDAGSRNGSWHNGAKLTPGKPEALENKSRIKAAAVTLTYYAPAGLIQRMRGG